MENLYIPNIAIIIETRKETPDIKTFRLSFKDREFQRKFIFKPGQFIELSVFGYGEAPFSISSSPNQHDYFELTIKRVGNVTSALFKLNNGSAVGVRGPFGNGFPIQELENKNILFIGGGIGLAPLRSLINFVLSGREKYGDLTLMYGARTPKDIVFKEEIETWRKHIDVHLTVDVGDETWKGTVGVVTVLFKEVDVDPKDTIAVMCGPPIMMHFVTKELLKLGFPENQIILSLERLMKCGIGICGHCNIGRKYVCKHGPVFTYKETKDFLESAI
jgi:sulfite reductase subunit B